MELGKTVDYIRKAKGLTIKDLCGNFMSRSNYNRFSNGEITTSSSTFIKLLESLNITLQEFMFIFNNFSNPPYQNYYEQLYLSMLSHNLECLKTITINCRILYKKTGNLKYQHLFLTTSLLIAHLQKKPLNPNSIKIINNYLFHSEIWTYYELTLFSTCLFIFRPSRVHLLLNTALKCANRFSTMNSYIDESVRLICHAVFYFLELNDLNSAKKWFSHIQKSDLSENYFYEKLLIKFTASLLQLMEGQPSAKKNIYTILAIFDTLDMPYHKQFFFNLSKKIE